MKKIRFPFPTSRNDQLRGGSGWDRIEKSLQYMAAYINGNNITSPLNYGAIGDGVTDDSSAIQAAINSAGNSPVYIDKNYAIDTPIIIPSGTVIYGNGKFISDGNIFSADDSSNISIIGVTFEQDAETGDTYKNNNCLYFKDSTKISVIGCKFSNINGISAVCCENCTDINISYNYIDTYIYSGIMLLNGTNKAIVNDNSIINCIAYATDPLINNSYGITLSAIDSETAVTASNIVCKDNYIKNTVPHWEGIDAHGCINTLIDSNTVINALTGISIVTGSVTDNVIISKNICINDYDDTIDVSKNNIGIVVVSAANNKFNHVSIIDNIIDGYGNTLATAKATDANSGGIRISNVIDCNVSGNHISMCGITGIVASTNCIDTIIRNNTINGIVKRGTKVTWGIEVDSNGHTLEICNNLLSSLETATIERGIVGASTSPSYTIAKNNRLNGSFTTFKYGNFSYMLVDVMGAAPTSYSSKVGQPGDVVYMSSVSDNVVAYICTGAGDGSSTASTWAAIKSAT